MRLYDIAIHVRNVSKTPLSTSRKTTRHIHSTSFPLQGTQTLPIICVIKETTRSRDLPHP
jgi:hypothetical protein